MSDTKVMEQLHMLEQLSGADVKCAAGNAEEYLAELRRFLEGPEFMRLGHALNAGQWNAASMRVKAIRSKSGELGIRCFDRWLQGIRDCMVRGQKQEALQLMAQVTAKRVQLRKVFEEKN